jgi:hypothetical protein
MIAVNASELPWSEWRDAVIAEAQGAFAGWNQIGGSSTSYSVPITVGPPALT